MREHENSRTIVLRILEYIEPPRKRDDDYDGFLSPPEEGTLLRRRLLWHYKIDISNSQNNVAFRFLLAQSADEDYLKLPSGASSFFPAPISAEAPDKHFSTVKTSRVSSLNEPFLVPLHRATLSAHIQRGKENATLRLQEMFCDPRLKPRRCPYHGVEQSFFFSRINVMSRVHLCAV